MLDSNNSLAQCSTSCEGQAQFSQCANGPSVSDNGGCNAYEACGKGNSWTKYKVECKRTDYNAILGETCKYALVPAGEVCAIGDKCLAGKTYLHASTCECGSMGSITKYCCSTSGQPEACTTSGVTQDNYSPPEGQCPGGSTLSDYPRVRSSQCVPIAAAPTCRDGIRNGSETGVDCGGSCVACQSTPPPPPSATDWTITCCDDHPDRLENPPGEGHFASYEVWADQACGSHQGYGTCSAPPPAPPAGGPPPPPPPLDPSCTVNWDVQTAQPSQTPFTAKVTGIAVNDNGDAGWSNVVWRVDGGSWQSNFTSIGSGSQPQYQFLVNSGPEGDHTLYFAINYGSYTCSGTKTFTTVPKCDATALNMSVSENPVNVNNAITFYLSGTQGSTHVNDTWTGTGAVNCSGGFWPNKTCTATSPGTVTWTHQWQNCALDGNCNLTSPVCSKTFNLTIGDPDTVRPTCDPTKFQITPNKGIVGEVAPIFTVSSSDNRKVQLSQIKNAGSGVVLFTDTNTTTQNTPYDYSRTLNTAGMTPGVYQYNIHITDASGNVNNTTNIQSCTKTLTLEAPPWFKASCDANGVFSGCKPYNGTDCEDWGDSTQSTWAQCQQACSLPVAQRNNYCTQPTGTISCPSSVAKNNGNWTPVTLTTSSNATTPPGTRVFVHSSTCQGSSCNPATGWTEIPSCATSSDSPASCTYNPPSAINPNSARTFALFTRDLSKILSTCDVRFDPVCREGDTRVASCDNVATAGNACSL